MKIKIHVTLDELKEFYLKSNKEITTAGYKIDDIAIDDSQNQNQYVWGDNLERYTKKSETIRDITDNFVKITKEKGITLGYSNEYGVDADIFNWLPNATVSTEPIPTGDWTKVDTKGTPEKEMLKTAVKMSLSQAIQKFTEMLKNGEFDKLETYRIIFLTDTDTNGNPLKLYCSRNSDGKLFLSVNEVVPDYVWRVADDAWFDSQQKL